MNKSLYDNITPLRLRRITNGLSMQEVAERTGISIATASRIETGVTPVTNINYCHYLEALEILSKPLNPSGPLAHLQPI